MIHLLTVSTQPDRHFEALMSASSRFGFHATVLGEGLPWTGFGLKLRLLHEHLRALSDPGTLVLFVDAHDVLLVRSAEAVQESYARLHSPIVACAEKYCYPDKWKAAFYPEVVGPWRFLNSGGILGEAGALLDCFEEYAHIYHDAYDDQRWWTDCFLADLYVTRRRRIRLDVHCEIFQCLVDCHEILEFGEEVRNTLTGTRPAVFHGPGHADLSPVLAWLSRRGAKI